MISEAVIDDVDGMALSDLIEKLHTLTGRGITYTITECLLDQVRFCFYLKCRHSIDGSKFPFIIRIHWFFQSFQAFERVLDADSATHSYNNAAYMLSETPT